jgi:hypothetical protein
MHALGLNLSYEANATLSGTNSVVCGHNHVIVVQMRLSHPESDFWKAGREMFSYQVANHLSNYWLLSVTSIQFLFAFRIQQR